MGQHFSSEPIVEKETERDSNATFNVAVSSCQGWRMSQEDNHSLMIELPGEQKASFFAVFDGHGSARVSKHASESLWKHLIENEEYKKGNFKEALEQAFLTFDREVNESYNAQLAGTTAVCVLIVDNVIYCANIGDSRAVAAVNCECVPLSHDHKPESPLELKRILAAGGYVLGNRINGNLALSRAFGDFHYKGNQQLPPEQQIVSPCPDIKRIELNDDVDFIVLACDGIWDVLTSKEVVEFVISRLEQNVEPGLICEQLTTRCLATDYELVIGCDNMTVLLVCYTRGRSWEDYCTEIFNKNTKNLGVPRTRAFNDIDTLNEEVQQSRLGNTWSSRTTASENSHSSTTTSTESASDSRATSDSTRSSGSVFDFAANEMRLLLDVLNQVEKQDNPSTSLDSDRTPPIEEIVDSKEATKEGGAGGLSSSNNKSSGSEREGDNSGKREPSEFSSSKNDDTSSDSQKQGEEVGATSHSVTEIHLSSPDDNNDDGSPSSTTNDNAAIVEERDDVDTGRREAGTQQTAMQSERPSSNIIELHLSTPSDNAANLEDLEPDCTCKTDAIQELDDDTSTPADDTTNKSEDTSEEGEEQEEVVEEAAATSEGSAAPTNTTGDDDSGGGGGEES